jgi:hypothetical protein
MHRRDSLHTMSLIDKESDVSKSLKLLLIGYRQDKIDLTRHNSPIIIGHKPASCPSCTEWYKKVREIGRAHPDLFDKDGYVKESVIGTLDIGQQRRLNEIGQLMDTHLKRVLDEEIARRTREAAEKDSVSHDASSHSLPPGDRAPYRTSISASCADPIRSNLDPIVGQHRADELCFHRLQKVGQASSGS